MEPSEAAYKAIIADGEEREEKISTIMCMISHSRRMSNRTMDGLTFSPGCRALQALARGDRGGYRPVILIDIRVVSPFANKYSQASKATRR